MIPAPSALIEKRAWLIYPEFDDEEELAIAGPFQIVAVALNAGGADDDYGVEDFDGMTALLLLDDDGLQWVKLNGERRRFADVQYRVAWSEDEARAIGQRFRDDAARKTT